MSISSWLMDRRDAALMTIMPIFWQDSKEWRFEDGALVHRTGGFFSVRGYHLSNSHHIWNGLDFPMIDQPEIGLLGFLVAYDAKGPCWLLQAKAEPGSVDFVQIGPSVQATESNYLQRHGGKPTPYLDLLLGASSDELSVSVEQSEQGARFYNKYNRNAVRILNDFVEPAGDNWHWFSAGDLRLALGDSFTLNTDSRSVIATAPWRLLCEDAEPFSADRYSFSIAGLSPADATFFRSALRASYTCDADISTPVKALQTQSESTDALMQTRSLYDLTDWRITAASIEPITTRFGFEVRNFTVHAPFREVVQWTQPLIVSREVAKAILLVRYNLGIIEFFFRFSEEPGFVNRVQYGPSRQSEGADSLEINLLAELKRTRLILELTQSDEGGRFLSSVVRYEIRLIDCHDLPVAGQWLNMAQIEQLCRHRGALTNEARTLISILLAFA